MGNPFHPDILNTFRAAAEETRFRHHERITPEHFLLAMLKSDPIASFFREHNINRLDLLLELESQLTPLAGPKELLRKDIRPPLAPLAKRIVEYGIEECYHEGGHMPDLRPHHFLLGISRLEDTPAAALLHRHNLTYERLRDLLPRPSPRDIRNSRGSGVGK